MTARFKDHMLGPDIHANQPAAASTPAGALYMCTTHNAIEINSGTAWSTWGLLAGGALTDPTTTKGDLLVRSSSAVSRLAVGTNGQALVADSTQTLGVKWSTIAGGSLTPPTLIDKANNYTASGNTVNVTLPAGANCVAGDLLVIMIVGNGAFSSLSGGGITAGNFMNGPNSNGGSSGQNAAIVLAVATASSAGSTLTINWGASAAQACYVAVVRGWGGIETEDINVNVNAVLTQASPPLKGAYKTGCLTIVAAGKRAATETLAGTGLTVVTARSGDATSTALFQAAATPGLIQSIISSSGATSAATAVAAVVLAGL